MRVRVRSKKSIAIFCYKQRLLSLDMKIEVVQHVPRISKTIELRFVLLLLLLLLLRDEFRHSDQDQTRSVLDRIRHDQGFPILLWKMAS